MSVRIMHLREKEHPEPEHFICKKIIAVLPFSGGCHNIREFFLNTHPRSCGCSDFIFSFRTN